MKNPDLSDFLARSVSYLKAETFGATFVGIRTSAQGDPMWNIMIPDTTYNWNATTEMQSECYNWYRTNTMLPGGIQPGSPTDQTLQQIMDANKGPNVYWNWSYDQWSEYLGYPVNS